MPLYATHKSNLTQESLRGGVPPFNGGAGGRYPQIRVLPSSVKLATHQYLSSTATLSATTYRLVLPTHIDIDRVEKTKKCSAR